MNRETKTPRRRWRFALITLGVLVAISTAALGLTVGHPRNWYGFVRYATPHMSAGHVAAGAAAPDAMLTALDGTTSFRLRDRAGKRPLVLVFGSFT